MRKKRKQIIRILLYILGSALGLVVLFLLVAHLCVFILVNKDFEQPKEGIDIYIKATPWHTSFILPSKNELVDYKKWFYHPDLATHQADYVQFGWGEREYFPRSYRRKDVQFSTTCRALFWPSASVMQVTYKAGSDAYFSREEMTKIRITEKQYLQLSDYIIKSFTKNEEGAFYRLPEPDPVYRKLDFFYASDKTYHLFYMCNDWTNKGLKTIGVTTPVWTPFSWTMHYQLERLFEAGDD